MRHFFAVTDGRAIFHIYNFVAGIWEERVTDRFSMNGGSTPHAVLRLDSQGNPYILVLDQNSELIVRKLQ